MDINSTTEGKRLLQYRRRRANWKQWGPFVSDRAWGTVREDYSEDGAAWNSFTHDMARSRVFRWAEDGLAGFCDRQQFLTLSLAFWNGQDPILKERLFGLSGTEGNHGEDVKETYYHLDGTPTHSWMQMLYRYPQLEFPYTELVEENRRRTFYDDEFELEDTGIFAENRFFDIYITWFKVRVADVCCEVELINRGPEPASCSTLVQATFRNTWSWGYPAGPIGKVRSMPQMTLEPEAPPGTAAVNVNHEVLGQYLLYVQHPDEVLFTNNETNTERLYGDANGPPWVRDAFHRYIVNGERGAVNPESVGTRMASVHRCEVPSGGSRTLRFRLSRESRRQPFVIFQRNKMRRKQEADEFYAAVQNGVQDQQDRAIQRQALAGLLWSKQFYYFDVSQWLDGDPLGPKPPATRRQGRNRDWRHLHNFDIVSMPDKWEYPWYAVWDLAFHCVPFTRVDPDFAKRQLELVTREWYIHPNGQLPAYEWNFGDANPPVHAWGAWRVFRMDAHQSGKQDIGFLKEVFHKLLLNFTWWVNRKDADGNNVFSGGFLGLDNISLFDRSEGLPEGGELAQADGTAWMGFYALEMMKIALFLSSRDSSYLGLASKFYEHFLRIAFAVNGSNETGLDMWDEEDGFYYDVLHMPDGSVHPLKVRSMVGLIPLFAVASLEHLEDEGHDGPIGSHLATFLSRAAMFHQYWSDLASTISTIDVEEEHHRHTMFALVSPYRLRRILERVLSEDEFLSPYGVRSLSKAHGQNPVTLMLDGSVFGIGYEPGESRSHLYGGNSNWRGPVWFPINYLLIEALERFHAVLGGSFKVECPTGSGQYMNLMEVAHDLSRRLTNLFRCESNGMRPYEANSGSKSSMDPLLFHEYFDGDTGKGLGASHQTGWTALVSELVHRTSHFES